jgi:hypothetical protein
MASASARFAARTCKFITIKPFAGERVGRHTRAQAEAAPGRKIRASMASPHFHLAARRKGIAVAVPGTG